MTAFKTLDDIDVAGKSVLVRADLNLPMIDGKISDATRLKRLVPTLNELSDKGAKVVVMSHFGRPKGAVDANFSLGPVAGELARVLGRPVAFATDCIGEAAERTVGGLKSGEVALLENLRFHPGEEANDDDFAARLAALGEIYVDDAFSVAHRAHASVDALARRLPSVMGRLMQAEIEALTAALENPVRPLVAIVGGAKISTKIDLLSNICKMVDCLVIGGAMANTFLAARGIDIGASLSEDNMTGIARDIVANADVTGTEILLPFDAVVAGEFKAGASCDTVTVDQVPADAMILDIGPASAEAVVERINGAQTLIWNGPLGAFEAPPFDAGTNRVAQAAAERTRAHGLLSIAGGGDTMAALIHAGVVDDFSYISSAGGAFLEWLEGKELPGVAALRKTEM
ncbi:MAG: phosphoglycerate kinase [Alphaproteobacteria bacterium]